MEDWGFMSAWQDLGALSIVEAFPNTVGRPLHLFPHALGGLLGQGASWGYFLVLGLIAASQFATANWALRKTIKSDLLRLSFGFVISTHPLWAAGFVLRFLPASFSLLMFLVWLGFAIRYQRTSRLGHLYLSAFAILVSLLTYQALALTFILAAVLVSAAIKTANVRSRWALIGSTFVAVGAITAYSAGLAPLFRSTYESSILGAGSAPFANIFLELKTVGQFGFVILLALLVLFGFFVLNTEYRRCWSKTELVTMGIVGGLSCLSGLTYVSSLHLNDPERVLFPVSTSVWVLVAMSLSRHIVLKRPQERLAIQSRAAGVAIIFSALVSASNILSWADVSDTQRQVIFFLKDNISHSSPEDKFVLEDSSGKLGDVYLFLPPHLEIAKKVSIPKPVGTVELCTSVGVERVHPVADRFPIATTDTCSNAFNLEVASKIVKGMSLTLFKIL